MSTSGGSRETTPRLADNLLCLFVRERKSRLAWTLIRREYEKAHHRKVTMGMLKELAFTNFSKIESRDPKSDSWVTLSLELDDWCRMCRPGTGACAHRLHMAKDAHICDAFTQASLRSKGTKKYGSAAVGCRKAEDCQLLHRPAVALRQRLRQAMAGRSSMPWTALVKRHNEMYPSLCETHAPSIFGVRKRFRGIYDVTRSGGRSSEMTISTASGSSRSGSSMRRTTAPMKPRAVAKTSMALNASAVSRGSGFSWASRKAERKATPSSASTAITTPATDGSERSEDSRLTEEKSAAATLERKLLDDRVSDKKTLSPPTAASSQPPVSEQLTDASLVTASLPLPSDNQLHYQNGAVLPKTARSRVDRGGSKVVEQRVEQSDWITLRVSILPEWTKGPFIEELVDFINTQCEVTVSDVYIPGIHRSAIVTGENLCDSAFVKKCANGWVNLCGRTLVASVLSPTTARFENINAAISRSTFEKWLHTDMPTATVTEFKFERNERAATPRFGVVLFEESRDADKVLMAANPDTGGGLRFRATALLVSARSFYTGPATTSAAATAATSEFDAKTAPLTEETGTALIEASASAKMESEKATVATDATVLDAVGAVVSEAPLSPESGGGKAMAAAPSTDEALAEDSRADGGGGDALADGRRAAEIQASLRRAYEKHIEMFSALCQTHCTFLEESSVGSEFAELDGCQSAGVALLLDSGRLIGEVLGRLETHLGALKAYGCELPPPMIERQVDAALVRTDTRTTLYLKDATLKLGENHIDSLRRELCRTLDIDEAYIEYGIPPAHLLQLAQSVVITMPVPVDAQH